MAQLDDLLLISGHYEGFDESSVNSSLMMNCPIGDYVLTNGALPAMVIVDAVTRFVARRFGR